MEQVIATDENGSLVRECCKCHAAAQTPDAHTARISLPDMSSSTELPWSESLLLLLLLQEPSPNVGGCRTYE